MSDVIDHAAFRVTEAESKLEEANGKLASAKAAADEIASRIAALETERSGIIAAARAGDQSGALGLRLGVLDADLGDLRKIAADGKAGLTSAQNEVARAAQAVVAAEQALQLVKDEVLERELVARVDQLAQLLGAAIDELRAIWARKRARPTWAPAQSLVSEMQRLRFVADGRQSDGIVRSRPAA